jgi:hypothetical protein
VRVLEACLEVVRAEDEESSWFQTYLWSECERTCKIQYAFLWIVTQPERELKVQSAHTLANDEYYDQSKEALKVAGLQPVQ